MGKKEDPDEWIMNLERLKQRIAECGKTIDDNELVMHILYHLPTEYDTINDQYLKDLDDGKDVDLEDLRADLQRKYDRLVDSGRIEKINDDGNDKLVKEERALKTGFKKQFKGKCRVCCKIGHKGTDSWTLDSNKEKQPTGYNDKNDGNRNYKFNGNCNYCNKKGHKEADCRAKQRDKANNIEDEFALVTTHTIRKGTTHTPYYLFYGSDAPYTQHLQVFGKLAIVKVLNTTNKLSDRGMKAIFVGYADKHVSNVYRFINPNTNKIILSRDVKWLERKYGDEKNVKPSSISNVYQDIKGYEEADDDDTMTTDLDEENNTNKSDTDEEIEMIIPSSTTAIGPPIESGKELICEVRGIDIGQ